MQTALIERLGLVAKTLALLYDHCRLYHRDVEQNNVGTATRTALADLRSLIKEAEGQKPDVSKSVKTGYLTVWSPRLGERTEDWSNRYPALGEKP